MTARKEARICRRCLDLLYERSGHARWVADHYRLVYVPCRFHADTPGNRE